MAESSYDCVVVGSGPGGYVAAIRAAQLGMETAVVEKDRIGGRCLNYACIPAKAVLRAADVLAEVSAAERFGIKVEGVSVDIAGVTNHRNRVVQTLTGGVSGLLRKNKVEVIEGSGAVTAAGNVRVGDRSNSTEVEAGTVVLATGSVPRPVLDLSFGGRVLGTETLWALEEVPTRLAVIGAGASGTEVASAFGRLGSEVLLLEALPQILPLEDEEIAAAAAREIAKQNVKIATGASVESVEVGDQSVSISYDGGTEQCDYVVIAAGRGPDVEGLGLEDAGVSRNERGFVEVDDRLRTSAAGVYAIGDLVPGPALAHKASEEGVIAVEDAAGLKTHALDGDYIPAVTFCSPQVASFGLTEKEAADAGHDIVVGKVPVTAVGAPTLSGERSGLIKIVGERTYGELLGGHILAAHASDLIEELVMARQLEGGFAEVARTVHPHPAFSEAVLEAARAADGWLIHG